MHVMSRTLRASPHPPRVQSTAPIRGRWLTLARVVWIAVTVLSVAVFVEGMGPYHHQVQTFVNGDGFVARNPRRWYAGLHAIGLSVQAYANYIMGLQILIASVLLCTGLLIFWRKSNEWIGLITSLSFVMFGMTAPAAGGALDTAHSPWHLVGDPLSAVGFTSFFLLGYIFPDGRFVPRWTRWMLIVAMATAVIPSLPVVGTALTTVNNVLSVPIFVSFLVAPIYRYRRTTDPSQRQQIKWAVMGLTVAIGSFVIASPLGFVLPVKHNDVAAVLYDMGSLTAVVVCFALVPVFLGVAIFRYRLWDIDVLINRALVYGLLTVTVAALYIVCVVGVQFLVHTLTGQNSNLAVAVSTLAIVALFQPLRRRIQVGIDHRFYRRKYNAAQTLAMFNATLRDEVDLEHLSAELKRVVQDTVQPAHVSLWLRNAHRE